MNVKSIRDAWKVSAKGCIDTFVNLFDLLVSVKIVGTLYCLLPSQCWSARFGELTAINNVAWEDEEKGQKQKTAFAGSVPTISETVGAKALRQEKYEIAFCNMHESDEWSKLIP